VLLWSSRHHTRSATLIFANISFFCLWVTKFTAQIDHASNGTSLVSYIWVRRTQLIKVKTEMNTQPWCVFISVFVALANWSTSLWRSRASPRPSRVGPLRTVDHTRPFVGVSQKSIFKRLCQFLAIDALKMAPRTSKGLQERAWDAPT